ncbi:myeloperoxidase-like [Liolophura sinensis]|uniref:myeloperoxidase-like n=1 Tax=Liolophura sinensis TaxID=3198878 RepID=UPI003157FA5A
MSDSWGSAQFPHTMKLGSPVVDFLWFIHVLTQTPPKPRAMIFPNRLSPLMRKHLALNARSSLPRLPRPKPGESRPPSDRRIIEGGTVIIPGGSAFRDRAPPRMRPPVPLPRLAPSRPLDAVIREAVENVKTEDELMISRLRQGIDSPLETSSHVEPLLFSESPLDASTVSKNSRIINWIARLIKGSRVPLAQVLSHPEAAKLGISCPYTRPVCDRNAKYRTFDGTCNNLGNPLLGSAFTPFTREVGAEYTTDPITKRDDLPKTQGVSGQLKSPRDISQTVHQGPESKNEDSIWSMEFSLWGQFLSHDIADRAPIKGYNNSILKCCEQSHPTPRDVCVNIETQPGDIFRRFNNPCLGLSRSLEVTDINCRLGKREQLNQASSYVDGSAIYGISEARARRLRAGVKGDDRANVYAGLIAIETVWMREHNKVASELATLNPTWNDEKLFQETRRIIVALVQHITYTDYLQGVVGNDNMVAFGLNPEKDGYFTGYKNDADPSLSNAFVTSAMRFGHSMIRNSFSKRDRKYVSDGSPALNLKDIFFRSSVFLKEEDPLMRGFVADASTKCDRIMSDSLVNHLHQTTEGNGGDLAAINIQRNREHGIPSYNTYRLLYGLTPAKQFDTSPTRGFKDQTAETVNLFKLTYTTPDDVELWTAGLSEVPEAPDIAVGPLFAKMIARQFRELKRGDRFYFETNDPLLRFTPAQLNAIRDVRFSKILCNTMLFDTIQPNAFLVDTVPGNSRISCSLLKDLNLIHWKEQ